MKVFPCNTAASLWQALHTRRYKQPGGSLSGEPTMLIRAHCTVRDGSVGYRMSVSEEHNEHIIFPQTLKRKKKKKYRHDVLKVEIIHPDCQ